MSGQKKPSVRIQKPAYCMASTDGESAEINVYGEIVETHPKHWLTGEPLEGDYIVQGEFLSDLGALAGVKALTLRIHSIGGDAGVSMLIHNRLREMSSKGTKLICVVDGVSMSGGSLIMCACDEVRVNPSSLIMIHNAALSLWGGYNANELRQVATQLDAWDKAQVSIYKRKTGLSDTVLSHMMGDTTYMTGKEAVEKGFADELIEDAEPAQIAASADGRTLFVNGRTMHLTPGMFAPDSIPTVKPEAADSAVPADNKSEGGTNMDKDQENLQQEDRVQAERKRIQEIDVVAALYDAETVREAKYGEHPCTAQEMTYRAAQKAVQQGRKALGDMEADTKASGVQEVQPAADPGTPPPKESLTQEQRMTAARAEVKALFGKKMEG